MYLKKYVILAKVIFHDTYINKIFKDVHTIYISQYPYIYRNIIQNTFKYNQIQLMLNQLEMLLQKCCKSQFLQDVTSMHNKLKKVYDVNKRCTTIQTQADVKLCHTCSRRDIFARYTSIVGQNSLSYNISRYSLMGKCFQVSASTAEAPLHRQYKAIYQLCILLLLLQHQAIGWQCLVIKHRYQTKCLIGHRVTVKWYKCIRLSY